MHTQKLGIVGLGNVGDHVLAYACQSELFGEIVTIDLNNDKAHGMALDQAHATGLFTRNNVNIHAGSYDDLTDADIIIITATYVYQPGETPPDRQALLEKNANIMRSIMDEIVKVTKDAILIFISNPLDTVVHMAATEYDYPAEYVLGTGCMLDSARMKYILGQHYGVDPKSVDGYIMGEHGYTAFPVLSRTTIAGIPYAELSDFYPDVEQLSADDLQKRVVDAAYEVFDAKNGVTNAAVAQCSIEMSKAILLDEKSIFSIASVFKDGGYGNNSPYTMSVPTVLGRNGAEKRFEVGLNDWETEKLHASIQSIQDNIALGESLKN